MKPSSYDTRYKHKLNMLEPGSKMLAIAGVLFGLGLICKLFSWSFVIWVLFACAAVLVLVLLILITVELHQDKVLNQIAEDERKNNRDERT